MPWPRPVPTIGDPTSSAQRAGDPQGWAFEPAEIDAFYRVVHGRRDVRRFRPDPVPAAVLDRVLAAAHAAPSVGHCQPWRFVLVEDAGTRTRAALLADRERLAQAAAMDGVSGRQLLDLDLEGIREAPLGIVVCCDRRVAAAGVLGRATFVNADLWSVVCAVQNMWLAARAEGLGIGWVTLFRPDDLAELVGAPDGVTTLGWFCLGWPDERPPSPGLERRGWSARWPLERVVLRERWPADQSPPAPVSHLAAAGARVAAPAPDAVVGAHDTGDHLLSPPGSLGVLDRAVDRVIALGQSDLTGGTLVVAASDHPVVELGVSAFSPSVTRHVAEATVAGQSVGAVAAAHAGLGVLVVDAGIEPDLLPGAADFRPRGRAGDLLHTDALALADVERLLDLGATLGAGLVPTGLVALGEIGIGNTTVAAAVAAALLGASPDEGAQRFVGLGSGADSAMLAAKREVVAGALRRARPGGLLECLAQVGGGELAALTGIVLGVARAGGVVVLDGMATSVAALAAVGLEPGVAAHLVAGQRSREIGHGPVLDALGLEPLLDLRVRAGEGVGAAMAAQLLLTALDIRRSAARVVDTPS